MSSDKYRLNGEVEHFNFICAMVVVTVANYYREKGIRMTPDAINLLFGFANLGLPVAAYKEDILPQNMRRYHSPNVVQLSDSDGKAIYVSTQWSTPDYGESMTNMGRAFGMNIRKVKRSKTEVAAED